jgi:hypothetical protein
MCAMSLDVYRTYLDGLDLSDKEKSDLIEALQAIIENIVNNLIERRPLHGTNQ